MKKLLLLLFLIPNLVMAEEIILKCKGEEFSSYLKPKHQKSEIEPYIYIDINAGIVILTNMREVIGLDYQNKKPKTITYEEDKDEFKINKVSEGFITFKKERILSENMHIMGESGGLIEPLEDDYLGGYIDRINLEVKIKNKFFESKKSDYSKSFSLQCEEVKQEI